ncbi:hypothetical protein BD410DRAFT_132134 [Rickenella mellea]|uniref:Uncharacterized protein n=1 Tax=Rickenella mellea TaxID=50990 RepID=A0A4Y7Q8M4_9AGAM|nr:hypothetical protein BD410DRAFT_132134 [Rickenella mellea]
MTNRDFLILQTLTVTEIISDMYLNGELSDEELEIPPHMVPPNPDDSDILPSQVHPSYPYGNPTNIKHPAARPRAPFDPSSRALFEDMGYAGGGVNGALRWKDLALDTLLPVDRDKEEAERAVQARKMASGAGSNNNPPQQQRGDDAQLEADQALEDDDEEGDNDDDEEDDGDDDDDDDDSEREGHMDEDDIENYEASFEDD